MDAWFYDNYQDFTVVVYVNGAWVASARQGETSLVAFRASGDDPAQAYEMLGYNLDGSPGNGRCVANGVVKDLARRA